MKQCQMCKTVYTDDTLLYCLADGSVLVEAGEEIPTVISSRAAVFPVEKRSTPAWVKAAIAIAVIVVLLVITSAIALTILYSNLGNRAAANVAVNATATPSPTPDAERERLQKELANAQRQLANAAQTPATAQRSPAGKIEGAVTARVNSPNDGFLALRDFPDTKRSVVIANIPHGTTVTINNCEPDAATVGGHRGRWCQVDYAGETGYVFDAWLDR
jgi:hypothetical protein